MGSKCCHHVTTVAHLAPFRAFTVDRPFASDNLAPNRSPRTGFGWLGVAFACCIQPFFAMFRLYMGSECCHNVTPVAQWAPFRAVTVDYAPNRLSETGSDVMGRLFSCRIQLFYAMYRVYMGRNCCNRVIVVAECASFRTVTVDHPFASDNLAPTGYQKKALVGGVVWKGLSACFLIMLFDIPFSVILLLS